MSELKITLVKSTIGIKPKQKKTIQALGLRKIGSTVTQRNNEAIKGMISKVSHLVKTEEI